MTFPQEDCYAHHYITRRLLPLHCFAISLALSAQEAYLQIV